MAEPKHPGSILKTEFLDKLDLTAYRLSKNTKLHPTRISEILKGRRAITANTAIRLAKYLKTTPMYWMELQNKYEIATVTSKIQAEIDLIIPYGAEGSKR